jgi:hypothetical protein
VSDHEMRYELFPGNDREQWAAGQEVGQRIGLVAQMGVIDVGFRAIPRDQENRSAAQDALCALATHVIPDERLRRTVLLLNVR